jgi:threonine/homoserine/homoserine lactone efflux protein
MSFLRNLKLFYVVFGISFMGSLPIGTLSSCIVNYTLQNRFEDALKFGTSAIIMEVIMIKLSLKVLDKVIQFEKLFKIICSIICVFMFVLSIKTLHMAINKQNFDQVLPLIGLNPFISGMVLSVLNPLVLPFWMGWTVTLKNKKILDNTADANTIYFFSIASGTCFSFIGYGILGNLLIHFFKENNNIINWILGFTILFTSLVIAIKLMRNTLHFNYLAVQERDSHVVEIKN